MKVFDPDSFLNVAVTYQDAVEVAQIADNILCHNSVVLYGRWNGREYVDFSTVKKPGDTHKILAYAPKPLERKSDGKFIRGIRERVGKKCRACGHN